MSRLLLLAGSEVLDEATVAQQAHAQILGAGLQAGDVVLLRGETRLCAHANAFARDQKLRVVSMRLDGLRRDDGEVRGPWYDGEAALPHAVSWPLQRDRAMAAAARKAMLSGWETRAAIVPVKTDVIGAERLRHLWRVCGELEVPCEVTVFETGLDVQVGPPPAKKVVPAPVADVVQQEVLSDFDQVWIDLETTGLSEKAHALIQIGAVHCDKTGRIVRREYSAMLKPFPDAIIDPTAMQVNGLSSADWDDAPEQREGLEAFLAWLPKKFIAANQNFSFDRRHLTAAFERCGLPQPGWHPERMDVCTKKLAAKLVKRKLIANAKLATLCDHFGVSNDGQHDALADARRAREVFLCMTSEMGGEDEND